MNCFRCGQPVDPKRYFRRRVKTGDSVRRSYVSHKVSSYHVRYGMRVVCPWCAKTLDRQEMVRGLAIWIEVVLALILLAAFLVGLH